MMLSGYSTSAKEHKMEIVVRTAMQTAGCDWEVGEAPQSHLERVIRQHFGIGREHETMGV